MYREILFLVLGLFMLSKGADYFVEASARLAKRLGVSDFIIGLTFVAIGTSLPELASSLTAAVSGYPLLVTGNIIGSNIANIALIMGLAVAIKTIYIKRKRYERDSYILLLSVILFFFFVQDGVVSKLEGIAFVALFVIYTLFLFRSHAPKAKDYRFSNFLNYIFDFGYVTTIKSSIIRRALKKNGDREERHALELFRFGLLAEFFIIIVSGIAIILGAKFLITEAVWLASTLRLPNNLIGISLIALGTSLPELMVSIKAARKGLGNMVIGNIIGSNIANILLVLGLSASIIPINIPELSIIFTIPIMAFFTLAFVYLLKRDWKIKKTAGVILVLLYIAFIITAFAMGWA